MPNIDTSKVKAIAGEMIDINNRYKDDFSAVEQAINRLKTDWQQPQKVSSAAFACFDEIKAKFFEPSITERRELAQFLCDAVGIGYEEAENTNKKLLEGLFEVGGVAASTAMYTNASRTSNMLNEDYKFVDVKKYSNVASHAEYARLCSIVNNLFDNEYPTKNNFITAIKGDDYFSDNDPIKHIKEDQIKIIDEGSGFGAIVIEDGESAMVIFAATNFGAENKRDMIVDVSTDLSMNIWSLQSAQAKDLVNDLSKKYDNIVVTGHSLGGFLATEVALKNEAVSKCITFDPPGRRYDAAIQEIFNSDRTSVITSYEAEGSFISSNIVGHDVGNVISVPVRPSGDFVIDKNHKIEYLCDALGGKKSMMESWGDITSGFGSNGGGTRF